MKNPLTMVKEQSSSNVLKAAPAGRMPRGKQVLIEAKASFERQWLQDPEQFDPMRDSVGRQRVERGLSLIQSHVDLSGKRVLDIGCGCGVFSRLLRDAGADVVAIDIASNALKVFEQKGSHNIELRCDNLPETTLEDDRFDVIFCSDVLAELHHNHYRLAVAEFARLLKSDGLVICATPIDIDSIDALDRFLGLMSTEFKGSQLAVSHHYLYLKIRGILEAPQRYSRAHKEPLYRLRHINKREKLAKLWFKLNSSRPLGAFWKLVSMITNPIAHAFSNSDKMLSIFESLSQGVWDRSAISYAVFVGKPKGL